ncbi:MAG: histidinol-phosphate transaminase [Oscillatoria sp. PMC 1051.18]|nr:histidinol-phosphate transaminase [Oscillatoria sp. PMC 1050.18]MEC5030241.1 histidinol-phosphate transaminase [Oscillatoria sp. PMC 1051.18]
MRYFRANINTMVGYTPGEQPPLGVKIVKLNTNENPYPPSPASLQVLQKIDGEQLRRYPDPMATEFREAVGNVFGFPPDWILVGNGSDEILNSIVRACVEQTQKVVYPTPTYILYRTLAQMQPAQFVEVDYDKDYNLPIEQLIAANGAVTLIASPNSPSGHAIPTTLLSQLASQLSGVLVIDEAYVDFAEADALEIVKTHDNVIVLRTLSKGYSLAGLRLGFCLANPSLLEGLLKVKDSYNIDAIACSVGTAAILDQLHKVNNAERVKSSRAKLSKDLKQLGFHVYPSQANFLLVQPPKSNAEEIYQLLKKQGILVRYFKQVRLDNKLRITVGTEEQNQILIEVLTQILT